MIRTSLAIPAAWADVTAPWMTAVLADSFPGVEVTGVELLWRSDGSNRRARFALTYGGEAGPSPVFLKAEGAHRQVHARNGNLFNEPKLLGSGSPLPLDHARPLAVLIDEPALDWLVVLEDVTVRGADPRDATRPLTPAQAERGVRGLARLHREYWGFSAESHPSLSWVQTWAPTEGFTLGLARFIPAGLERAGSTLPAAVAGWSPEEVLDAWVRYVALLDRAPVTLLHADAHVGNSYVLPDDDVGFLDWQVARRGGWSQDLGYFLQGALTEVDRGRHERAVLEAYLTELGRDLDPDIAWLWYRASAVYGLAIWLSTLGTDGYQARAVSLALSQRYAAATADLDALGALSELQQVPSGR